MKDNSSLAHSTWNCKYYIAFAPQYRRIRKQLQEDIATNQISIKEYVDLFEKERKIKKGLEPLK